MQYFRIFPQFIARVGDDTFECIKYCGFYMSDTLLETFMDICSFNLIHKRTYRNKKEHIRTQTNTQERISEHKQTLNNRLTDY